tara:strand:+ start:4917 stop:5177 length:261 start_codon:yes stop_codon:yes gene_type:complete
MIKKYKIIYMSEKIEQLSIMINNMFDFNNQYEIITFLDLLKYELINLLDEDYSTCSDISSEEFNEKTEKEEINVAVDKEGFYSLTD